MTQTLWLTMKAGFGLGVVGLVLTFLTQGGTLGKTLFQIGFFTSFVSGAILMIQYHLGR